MRLNALALIVALFTASPFTAACGGHSVKQNVANADRAAFTALHEFQTLETAAFHANASWPSAEQHKMIGAKLSGAYTLVIDVAQAGLAIKSGMPATPQVLANFQLLGVLVNDVVELTKSAPSAFQESAASAQKKTMALIGGAR